MNKYLDITEEVKNALAEGRAVVALESTIISHGMPYPQNVETALKVEQIVRKEGAVPATIAILDGQLKAGLKTDDIEKIGQLGAKVTKASRRDLPFLVTQKKPGATTVAATMIIAEMAGISVFATGGIGGVHRGASNSFDISADLQELANTNVAVVSAGVKAILDLPLTLEYLETHGIAVIGYQTDEFPAFYTRQSGLSVDYRIDQPIEIARCLKSKWGMGLRGGMIIANPVPESHSLDAVYMSSVIQQALDTASQKGIKGKAVTPFLLAKVKELTKGESLVSNVALVLNNARLASKIALHL